MNRIGQHAVVIGASMSGLLAARVLSDFFDTVTLLERDTFPVPGEQRKGAPQGKHAHGLHARGREILEQMFPNFTQEMAAEGGLVLDASQEFRWFANGGYHQPSTSDLKGLLVSRPLLEAGVRTRVLALPNVRALENCDVPGVTTTEDRARVTGVRLVRRATGSAEEILTADLVVDATGRGSRTPAWLKALGYEQPAEERVKIDLGYTTCVYRRTPDQLAGRRGIAIAGDPPNGRTGVAMAQEGDRWIVTIGGYAGDFAPLDPQGFLDYARELPTPDIYALIKDAERLSEPVAYRFAASLRRRYERMTRFPAGYLVFGDAICSFNPVYGQGMSVAALEALVLQDCLAQGGHALAPRFFKKASTVVDGPWSVAVGNDLRYPHVEGRRTRMGQFINWYIGKLHIAAREDAALSIAFLRVVNMIASPASLLHPRISLRVLRGNLRPRAATTPGTGAIGTAPATARVEVATS
jgi:2-polyprenyl-6-methoxyphenol hydroxylase-like FAD-dependent oxidoreductase